MSKRPADQDDQSEQDGENAHDLGKPESRMERAEAEAEGLRVARLRFG